MSIKVLFLLPKNFERRNELQWIPLGIGYLSASLKKNGYEVAIIDNRIHNLSDQEIFQQIQQLDPTIIAVSNTTNQLINSCALLKKVKQFFPDTIIVLGGAHISALPIETLQQYEQIDFGIIGEGEFSLCNFLEVLNDQNKYSNIKGLVYRKDGNIYANKAELIPNLDMLPFPNREIFDLERYNKLGLELRGTPMTPIITSRGCPAKCIFCCKAIYGDTIRLSSASHVLEELGSLIESKYNYKEFHIIDDNFTYDMNRAGVICEEILKNKWKINLALPNGIRVDKISYELLELMKQAGFYSLVFGVESGDQKVVNYIKKGIKIEQVKKAVKWARELGFYVGIFLVMDLPGATYESENKSLRLALELEVDQLMVSAFTPYPGSPAFEELIKNGNINYKDWNAFRHDRISKGLCKDGFAGEELENLYDKFVRKFYFRPSYPFKLVLRHKSYGFKKLYAMLRNYIFRKRALKNIFKIRLNPSLSSLKNSAREPKDLSLLPR